MHKLPLRIFLCSCIFILLALLVYIRIWLREQLTSDFLAEYQNRLGPSGATDVTSKEYPNKFSQMANGGYSVSSGKVYYEGSVLPNMDAETFQYLGDGYAADAEHIYFQGQPVKSADRATFKVKVSTDEHRMDFIAEDKNAIFVEDKKLYIPKKTLFWEFYTFPSLAFLKGEDQYSASWAIFNDELYYYSLDVYAGTHSTISLLPGIDYKKAKIITDINSQDTLYLTDGKNVYYGAIKLEGVDLASFTASVDVAKDKYSVYRYGVKLKKADPVTFEQYENSSFSHDKEHVYFDNDLIEGVDVRTFQTQNGGSYSWDKNHVYYTGVKVPAADPKTFSALDNICWYSNYAAFGKDKNHVFRNGERLLGMDPNTFVIVDDIYVRDAKTILKCGKERVDKIPVREVKIPQSVPLKPITDNNGREDIGNGYQIDKKRNIYYGDIKLENVDVATFTSFGNIYDWATDKNFVYRKGRIVGGI